jgi:uncharacterized protein YggU (UPF0235/DUF167 family)
VTELKVSRTEDGASLEVRLQPRSSRRGVSGPREGALVVRVNAPPLEGRANEEARRVLADFLGLSPSRLRLAQGAKSRRKVFHVTGMMPEELRRLVEEAGKST